MTSRIPRGLMWLRCEDMIRAPISAVGVGPGRDEIVTVRDLLG